MEQQLWEVGRPVIEQDPGHIPVVGLEVAVADADSFRWRDYYKRALLALDEPMIDHKILPEHFQRKGAELRNDGYYKVTSELRWALEQALRYRHPAAFILDEAQHFKRIASGRRLLDQMDTLKSLANMTGTTHVLIGTYELLGFSQLSAQLDRRSYEIHFPRYHIDIPEEMLAFKRILLTFQRHLPLSGEPDFVARAEYFYERSVQPVAVSVPVKVYRHCPSVLSPHADRQAISATLPFTRTTSQKGLCNRAAWPRDENRPLPRHFWRCEAK